MAPSDYALLELIERLGGVQGRKRLQKLAYIAKLEGLPLDDEFRFHYYGTYSSGLAVRVDELVADGLLVETPRALQRVGGVEYGYEVAGAASEALKTIRRTAPEPFRERMQRGIDRAVALKGRDVFQLELATSLLYWRSMGRSWDEAAAITQQRKNAEPDSIPFVAALEIAGTVWNSQHPGD